MPIECDIPDFADIDARIIDFRHIAAHHYFVSAIASGASVLMPYTEVAWDAEDFAPVDLLNADALMIAPLVYRLLATAVT
jgi:hypothetical protein